MKVKQNNKKLLSFGLSLLLVVGGAGLALSKTTAYFSSQDQAVASGNVKNIDLKIDEPFALSNKNSINPGDYDIGRLDDWRDGKDHDLTFSVSNQGTESIITRNVIIISAKDNSELDMSNYSLVKPGMENNGHAAGPLSVNHKVYFAQEYTPGEENDFSEALDGTTKAKAIKYVLEGDILNGDKSVETGVDTASYAYGLSLLKESGLEYAGEQLNIELTIQSTQAVNASSDLIDPASTEWETIFKDKI